MLEKLSDLSKCPGVCNAEDQRFGMNELGLYGESRTDFISQRPWGMRGISMMCPERCRSSVSQPGMWIPEHAYRRTTPRDNRP